MADGGDYPNRDHRDKGKAKVADINAVLDKDGDDDDDDLITYNSEDDNQPSTDIQDSPSSKKRKPKSNHDIVLENLADRLLDFHFMNDTDNPARPGSRIVTNNNLCISKTLTVNDVLPTNPSLKLDPVDASLLADEPSFLDMPSPLSYKKTLLAFDEFDRQLNLLLSVHMDNGNHNYKITRDWSAFVKEYNLKSGDEVKFYKIKDDKISSDRYIVLRCSKKPKLVKRYKTF